MVMEDKKQTEEGMVDFSSWKVLALSPISKSCWSINLGASYLAGYFMCLLSRWRSTSENTQRYIQSGFLPAQLLAPRPPLLQFLTP